MNPPTIEDMGKAAEEIVWRVMGKGSDNRPLQVVGCRLPVIVRAWC